MIPFRSVDQAGKSIHALAFNAKNPPMAPAQMPKPSQWFDLCARYILVADCSLSRLSMKRFCVLFSSSQLPGLDSPFALDAVTLP